MALPLPRGLSPRSRPHIFPGDTPLLPSLFQPCFIPANRLVSSSLSHTVTGVNTAVGTISDRLLLHFNARLVPEAGPPA